MLLSASAVSGPFLRAEKNSRKIFIGPGQYGFLVTVTHIFLGIGKNCSQMDTVWAQTTLNLRARPRGFHLITAEVLNAIPELATLQVGWLHVFIQHTSASVSVNENADPTVRADFETAMNHAVPEDLSYQHALEGPDDMPAHVKASLLGSSITLPVTAGKLNLGTWQGIYLCEHRDRGGSRSLLLTLQGSRKI